MRLPRRFLASVALVVAVAAAAASEKKKSKKDKEEQTQVLQLPKDLPGTVTGNTRRLAFHVTPLSPRGLLSPQIREALKSLSHQCGGETVLKIRAFVAGSGDVRRVRDLVSEYFTDHKQPLPTLTLIRAGGLPMEGAQVVMEAIASARKDVNPHGLAFIAAQSATAPDPLAPVAPLAANSLAGLKEAVRAAGAAPEDVLRVTCFLSSLDRLDATRTLAAATYPKAVLDFVQTQRAPNHALAACEGVARLAADPAGGPVRMLNPDGRDPLTGDSQIALVNAPEVVLSGAQASFGYQERDARLAFERLQKELQQAGSSTQKVVFAHVYPLAQAIGEQVRRISPEFFDRAHPPAGSMVVFEGLPSMDAGFAVDVVAVK
jgi:enamine deaminase RidA (YjgF/YER057c/UK114 family)